MAPWVVIRGSSPSVVTSGNGSVLRRCVAIGTAAPDVDRRGAAEVSAVDVDPVSDVDP